MWEHMYTEQSTVYKAGKCGKKILNWRDELVDPVWQMERCAQTWQMICLWESNGRVSALLEK